MNYTRTLLLRTIVSTILLVLVAAAAASAAASSVPSGLQWRAVYDDAGRVVKTISPGGAHTSYSYRIDPEGVVRSVTRESADGSRVVHELDAFGRLVHMLDGAGSVHYDYDDRGRLVAVRREGAPVISYEYDSLDRRTELRVGDFYRVAYTYDFLGRLAAMDTPAGTVRYEYRPGQGEVIRSLPNGVKTIWKRRPDGQLERITHESLAPPGNSPSHLLAEFAYDRDAAGRITAIRETSPHNNGVTNYNYDRLGRLIGAVADNSSSSSYRYDRVGNRVASRGSVDRTYSYDSIGRLIAIDDRPTEHDEDGNLTAFTVDGAPRAFTFDGQGQLAKARFGPSAVAYTYDGNGVLLTRQTKSTRANFISAPDTSAWHPLIIRGDNGSRRSVVWEDDVPLAILEGGRVEWLLHDHLGTVRLVTDAEGHVQSTAAYDPSGVTQEALPSELQPGFAGLFWDGAARVYLTAARAFAPAAGAFLQPDPKKRIPGTSAESLSLYSYCGGDPINLVDRDGRAARQPVTFDERSRWNESFMRTFLYNTIFAPRRWSYSAYRSIHNVLRPDDKLEPSVPVALNTDPVERDDVIAEVIEAAEARLPPAASEREHYEQLHGLLHSWRQDPRTRPASIPILKAVTGHEWKVLENAAYRDRLMHTSTGDVLKNDGHLPAWLVDRLPYRDARAPRWLVNAGIRRWSGYHTYGELTGIPPNFFDRRTSGPWMTNTAATNKAYKYGLSYWKQEGPTAGKGVSTSPHITPATSWHGPSFATSAYAAEISPVGGVYLGGAGRAIEDLREIHGIQMGSNGNLALLSDQREVELPPLRIDDVVTVFRSVYLNGEGPTVTIDPNPENPEKSAMVIRHSEATADTYVGWVLYQADRLMKSYGQGVDNMTKEDIVSAVPGYGDVVDTVYFGGADPRKAQKGGIWERFWIVPAEARRFEGKRRELTLFDVPLKVKTQKMKWVGKELVDDTLGDSSIGALAFTSWFTANYDAIATERYLLPPPESGIAEPVPVFAELRKIALITAIAEKLRDDGVPMPFWMRDYEVRPVPFEHFTPALEVTRTRQEGNLVRTSRIFGGVELSPESKAVKTYGDADAAAAAPAEVRDEIARGVELAADLEHAVAAAIPPAGAAPLTVQSVRAGERSYKVTAVPGADTVALNPCRLDEADLIVPMPGGRALRLERHFNSFFNPRGAWGRGWSMDLPRLQEIRVPGSREGGKVSYTRAFELLTPLNSVYARFADARPVPELAGETLQVPDKPGPFLGLAETRPSFLDHVTTRVLFLRNGEQWHFTQRGQLVAIKAGPQITVYERDADGRIPRMIALLGDIPSARIDLEYSSGVLTRATGTSLEDPTPTSQEVSFSYDGEKHLTGVTSAAGTLGYVYEGLWIAAVTWSDPHRPDDVDTLQSFAYNDRGQVVSETRAGRTLRHLLVGTADGVEATTESAPGGAGVTRYDPQMRPREAVAADGTRTRWQYRPDGGVTVSVADAKDDDVTVTVSADGRERTIRAGGGPSLVARYDDAQRLVSLAQGQKTELTQQWRPDGQIGKVETDAQAVSYNYAQSGLLSSFIVQARNANDTLQAWRKTTVDRGGHPVSITDQTGLDLRFTYDSSGALASSVQQTAEGNFGYQVERDSQGRLRNIHSSWGDMRYSYDEKGALRLIESQRGGKSAAVELSDPRSITIRDYDGGVTRLDYHEHGALVGKLRQITSANGLPLAYDYDSENRLSAVTVGTQRRLRLGYDARGNVNLYAWEPIAHAP